MALTIAVQAVEPTAPYLGQPQVDTSPGQAPRNGEGRVRTASQPASVEAPEPASIVDMGDFDVFFDQVFPRAVRVARRMIGDPVESEDLAAEALARAYARWPAVRRHAAPEGWVLRTTINLAIDTLRKGKRNPEVAAIDGSEDIVALRVTLAAALGALSRRQREIVTMRYLADMSESDVAAALAITPGSVKTHLSRALARLRGVLGPQSGEVADGFAI